MLSDSNSSPSLLFFSSSPLLLSSSPLLFSSSLPFFDSVFAYGMTGSGKTHTMLGNSKDPGVIPLSFEQIFKQVVANAEHSDFSISISYMEIYCEIVRDIIEPSRESEDPSILCSVLFFLPPPFFSPPLFSPSHHFNFLFFG